MLLRVNIYSSKKPDTECNTPCSGNTNSACGGSNRLVVYKALKRGPVTNLGENDYISIGCFSDSVQARTLSILVQVSGGTEAMSVKMCTATCAAKCYSVSGVEYAGGKCCSRPPPLSRWPTKIGPLGPR